MNFELALASPTLDTVLNFSIISDVFILREYLSSAHEYKIKKKKKKKKKNDAKVIVIVRNSFHSHSPLNIASYTTQEMKIVGICHRFESIERKGILYDSQAASNSVNMLFLKIIRDRKFSSSEKKRKEKTKKLRNTLCMYNYYNLK